MSVGSAPTWYMMAVVTETVTLSFVLVLVCTSICLVIIETLVTVAMGHNTRLQPGWAIPENLPQFWMTPLSALSMHTAQKHWVAMFKRMSSRCPTGLCSVGTRGDMSEWPQVAAVSTRPHTTATPARQQPHQLCTQRTLAAPSAGNLGGGRGQACARASDARAHRGRGNDNAPAPGIPNHPPGTAAIATPTLNWRAAGRAAHGRARGCIALRPFFTEQGRARHIALAGSPVTRNADSTTPLCAHLQCRVLHLALPQMKRCCLDGRLLRRLPHRGCFVCFGSRKGNSFSLGSRLRMRTNE